MSGLPRIPPPPPDRVSTLEHEVFGDNGLRYKVELFRQDVSLFHVMVKERFDGIETRFKDVHTQMAELLKYVANGHTKNAERRDSDPPGRNGSGAKLSLALGRHALVAVLSFLAAGGGTYAWSRAQSASLEQQLVELKAVVANPAYQRR